MYGGERQEFRQLSKRLNQLVRNYNSLIRTQRTLALVTESYHSFSSYLPYIVLSATYFAGHLQLGQLTQASYAFLMVNMSLSVVLNQFNTLTDYAAVARRLDGYLKECESSPRQSSNAEIRTSERSGIATEHLSIYEPLSVRSILINLSVRIADQHGLLITGKTGSGKTLLLRTISGLWKSGSGGVIRPPLNEIMFLPQVPYMPLGSLREQLSYPGETIWDDAKLLGILRQVDLNELVDRFELDTECNWSEILSQGEQQRLAFGRLLLKSPRFAFLDEASSALDSASEQRLYGLLQDTNIVFVSIGHRASLRRYHSEELELGPDASWRLRTIERSAEIANKRST